MGGGVSPFKSAFEGVWGGFVAVRPLPNGTRCPRKSPTPEGERCARRARRPLGSRLFCGEGEKDKKKHSLPP